MSKSNNRNSVLEFFRFFFSITIVAFHAQKSINHVGINGNIGVSYFFIISGAFLAKNVLDSDNAEDKSIGLLTFDYLIKRISAIALPYYLLWIAKYCLNGIVKSWTLWTWVLKALKDIPTLTFLTATGLPYMQIMGGVWYISAMLMSIIVVYPLLLKFREEYVYIIAPICATVLLGFLSSNSDQLGSVLTMYGPFTKGFLWGLMGFNLGIFCYGISKYISRNRLVKTHRLLLDVIEIGAIAFLAYFAITSTRYPIDGYVASLLVSFVVLIELSCKTFFSMILEPFGNINIYLGRVSLYIYLSQSFFRQISNLIFGEPASVRKSFLCYVVIPVIGGFATMHVCMLIKKLLSDRQM